MSIISQSLQRLFNPQYAAGHGQNKTISTGRYDITSSEGLVKIHDKKTNTWTQFKNHGNHVHMTTSDGNNATVSKNMTIDLKDGTKVTLGVGQDGQMDNVSVMRNGQAKVISGLSDGRQGVRKSRSLNGFAVDAWQKDGTVLKAGQQVDDLYKADGKEAGNTWLRRRSGRRRGRWFQIPENLNNKGGQSKWGFGAIGRGLRGIGNLLGRLRSPIGFRPFQPLPFMPKLPLPFPQLPFRPQPLPGIGGGFPGGFPGIGGEFPGMPGGFPGFPGGFPGVGGGFPGGGFPGVGGGYPQPGVGGGYQPSPVGGSQGSSPYGDMYGTIRGINGEISQLKQQLQNEKDPNKRQEILMKLQEKQQERSLMITTLTNLMKAEFEAQRQVAGNLR